MIQNPWHSLSLPRVVWTRSIVPSGEISNAAAFRIARSMLWPITWPRFVASFVEMTSSWVSSELMSIVATAISTMVDTRSATISSIRRRGRRQSPMGSVTGVHGDTCAPRTKMRAETSAS